MKILQVVNGGDNGGAMTHICSLLKGINDKSIVHVLAIGEGDIIKQLELMNISYTVCKKNFLEAKKVIKQICKTEKIQIIHSHGAIANIVAHSMKGYCKIVSTIHSDVKRDYENSLLKAVTLGLFNQLLLKDFDAFITSNSLCEVLFKYGYDRNKMYILYNGISTDHSNSLSKEEYLKKYNIDNNAFVVCLCARLEKIKNISAFVKAANLIKEKDIHFIIAGEGSEKDSLKTLCKNKNIHFIGWENDVNSLFNAVDLNVLTSRYEGGVAFSLLQGGVYNVPALAPLVGPLGLLVENEKNGYIINQFDPNDIALKIKIMYNNTEMRIKMGENMNKKVKECFSIEKMASAQLEIYNSLT